MACEFCDACGEMLNGPHCGCEVEPLEARIAELEGYLRKCRDIIVREWGPVEHSDTAQWIDGIVKSFDAPSHSPSTPDEKGNA